MMKPKYPRRDKISNPVIEYKRKPKVQAVPAQPTFEEVAKAASDALDIAESGVLRPTPLVHEGARAYPALRATLGERVASRGRT